MTNTKNFRAVCAAGLALMAAAGLAGCATQAVLSTQESAPPSREAGLVTKDVELCFTNTSGKTVYVDWKEKVSTFDGSGSLRAGEKFCGEGPQPKVQVSYLDKFTVNLEGKNFPLYRPLLNVTGNIPLSIGEYGKCSHPGCDGVIYFDVFSTDQYSVGNSNDIDANGHHFFITREADNDWINFTIKILS